MNNKFTCKFTWKKIREENGDPEELNNNLLVDAGLNIIGKKN